MTRLLPDGVSCLRPLCWDSGLSALLLKQVSWVHLASSWLHTEVFSASQRLFSEKQDAFLLLQIRVGRLLSFSQNHRPAEDEPGVKLVYCRAWCRIQYVAALYDNVYHLHIAKVIRVHPLRSRNIHNTFQGSLANGFGDTFLCTKLFDGQFMFQQSVIFNDTVVCCI